MDRLKKGIVLLAVLASSVLLSDFLVRAAEKTDSAPKEKSTSKEKSTTKDAKVDRGPASPGSGGGGSGGGSGGGDRSPKK